MNEKSTVVLPEWGIKLRNLIDRMAPVVNEHHRDIDEFRQRLNRFEQQIAQQQTTIQELQTTVAVLKAQSAGNGPTTT